MYIADLRGEHKGMNVKKLVVTRKRPIPVRVMLSSAEKATLAQAADEMGVAMSVFMRISSLETARRRETKAAYA